MEVAENFAPARADVEITTPSANTVWAGGSTVEIVWRDNGERPSLDKFISFTLYLCWGSNAVPVCPHTALPAPPAAGSDDTTDVRSGSRSRRRKVLGNLMSNSGAITYSGPETGAKYIIEEIESLGYEATLEGLKQISGECEKQDTLRRTVPLRIVGMHCTQCPTKVLAAVEKAFPKPRVEVGGVFSLDSSVMEITYTPVLPGFTIREVVEEIKKVDHAFTI